MSTQTIDYAALAEQARQQAALKVDYAALAEQARSGASSQPKYGEDDYDDKGVTYFPGEKRKIDPATGRTLAHSMPGSFEGHPENIGQYPVATVGRAAEGAVDMSRGNVAIGLHKEAQAVGNAFAPMAPLMAVGAPVTALRALGGSVVGSKVAGAIANASGASPDQQSVAEDAGNILGGGVAATGALRALLGSPTRALVSSAAQKAQSAISPELMELLPGKTQGWFNYLIKAGKVADKLDPEGASGLADIVNKHSDKIAETSAALADALSKANALPPEGPTAKAIDVPDLRVQPGQQAPQNLLQRSAAPAVNQQPPAGGAFQVVPPEGAIQESKLPNMEIYKEPMLPPKPVKPPTLLEQLRQWDQIRQIHSQLEDQIGKGQDELQQWMEDHNQQAPGAKPASAAATAKARFDAARAKAVPRTADEPRVPTSDADMENLLMKSVQAAKAKKAMAAKAGD